MSASRRAPHRPTALTLSLGVALSLSAVPVLASSPAASAAGPDRYFDRLATYPVFQNVPDGVDPDEETVAEISAVSEDGRTVAYTDAAGGRIGFLDITDPSNPKGLGSHEVSGSEGGGEPTSVSIVGDHTLVVVDTSESFTDPSGRLDVVDLAAPHDEVASIDLGGQPDSIAISPDGAYAAIAIENQRDEEATPEGGEEGDLPQAPAGFVQVIELGDDPTAWTAEPVELPADVLAGLDTPEDAEPEYVDINADNQLALTLQENNGVAIIDLETRSVETAWNAGTPTIDGVDTTNDKVFNADDSITAPREPDAIQWVGEGPDGEQLVATANEGDWKGGTRGWTVFDAATGDVVWDAGSSFEELAISHGLFNDDRADNKGTEPEGMAFDTIGGTPYAFVGSERSNFVAVYDMTDPTEPRLVQALPTAMGPEGLLPIPERDLLVVSSEEDSAEDGYRAAVGIYELGEPGAKPAWPSIVSDTDQAGAPIGWTALGALSAVPGNPHMLWAASDAAAATGRIYKVDTGVTPAEIVSVREVHFADGELAQLDIEGIAARPEGGFWVASEGATGAENYLMRLTTSGEVVEDESIELPAEVTDHIGKWGLEGVTTVGSGDEEQVYVAVQRPLWEDPEADDLTPLEGDVARIGRYTPATGEWEWFGYPLDSTSTDGDWIGLSEITAVDADTLAVIERDKLSGPSAALKAITTVDVPEHGAATGEEPVMLTKQTAYDVLPDLRATHGWTQEKLEGLTIGADRQVYAVTDNDGLDNATGETQLLRLGKLTSVFADATATTTRFGVTPGSVRVGGAATASVTVSPAPDGGTVSLISGGKVIASQPATAGRVTFRVPTSTAGVQRLTATYSGSDTLAGSTSSVATLRVVAAPTPPAPPRKVATTTVVKAKKTVRAKRAKARVVVRVQVRPGASGRVQLTDRGRVVKRVAVRNGSARVVLRLTRGVHKIRAAYLGSATHAASTSTVVRVKVVKARR